MYLDIDSRFKEHFENLKQVFLYIINECDLKCVHCLYKPDLIFNLKEKEIELETALALISDFKEMGAFKLTIMGGEPTLYGTTQKHEPLLKLINEANRLGYQYIRIDTNGQFQQDLLLEEDFKKLHEITFSLDGPVAEINDPIRGSGSFTQCVSNIEKAIELGYKVDITCCLHKKLLKRDNKGNLLLDIMICFAESLGIKRINFHDLFKTGIPRDVWTGELDPSLEEWLDIYAEIQANIHSRNYKISVRFPQSFVSRQEFEANPEYFGYCPAKIGERVLIFPNGIIRICSLMIGTPYAIARFYDHKIVWDESLTNEIREHKLNLPTPCTNQSKTRNFGDLVPLCVSFKPMQEEIIWKEKLNWEERKNKVSLNKLSIAKVLRNKEGVVQSI